MDTTKVEAKKSNVERSTVEVAEKNGLALGGVTPLWTVIVDSSSLVSAKTYHITVEMKVNAVKHSGEKATVAFLGIVVTNEGVPAGLPIVGGPWTAEDHWKKFKTDTFTVVPNTKITVTLTPAATSSQVLVESVKFKEE